MYQLIFNNQVSHLYFIKFDLYNFISLIMHLVFPKNEPNLQRGSEKNCQACNKKFSVMLRQHQCKRCLKAVCTDCGNFKHFTFSSSNLEKQQHRICKFCKDSSDYIISLIKNKNLKFGEMSDIGKEWLKKIIKIPQTYGTDTSQHKIFTKEVFAQLWASYSFELRELIGLLTHQYQQSSIYDLVYNVYTTVVSASEGLSLTKIMHLIMYALCFCSLDKATILVLYLLQLKKQQKDIKNLTFKFIKALPYQKQYQKIQNYIFYRYDKYVDSFFVNASSIECSVFYIGEILKKKNLEDLFMFFSSHMYNNRELLYQKSVESSRDVVDLMLLRNCALLDITSNFKQIKNKNIMFQNLDNIFIDKLKKVQNGSDSTQRENEKQTKSTSQQEVNTTIDTSSKKPQLIKRQIPQNKGQTMQDSFTMYPQDDKLQQFRKILQTYENQKQKEQQVTTSEINSFKKMPAQDKNPSLNHQKCIDCQSFKRDCQILKKKCSELDLQKFQLKDKTVILQAQVLRLKKQTRQFDDQLVQLVHEKKTLQKALQQTKKQLEIAVNTSKTIAESDFYKKKLQQSQKQIQIQINKQEQFAKRCESIQSKLNQSSLALEQSDKTIQQLKSENESLKQGIQTTNGIINVLKSDKKLLENKSTGESTKIQQLQTALKKQIDQNKFFDIRKGDISRELQTYKHANKELNQNMKILQEKMTYISGENTKLNKQINDLMAGWNDKQFRIKQENKVFENKITELESTIFSLEQQLKVHTSNSNQDMKSLLQQTRKQYQQKLQKQIKVNNQLQKEVSQLQKIVGEKQTEMDKMEKDNLSLLNQLQQKTKINEQLSQKLTSFQLRNSQALAIENDLRNKYEELMLKAERNELQIQKKNSQIIKQKIAPKDAYIEQLQTKINEDIAIIFELKLQLRMARQNSTKVKHQQQIYPSYKSSQDSTIQYSKQQQEKTAILAQQNTSLREQLQQTNQINEFLRTKSIQMSELVGYTNKQYGETTVQILDLEDQNKHLKVQLQKSNKQNQELKSTLQHVQTILAQKQDEINHLKKSNAKNTPSLGQKLVFEKMQVVQAKNEKLKHQIKELQKQREGLLSKMDQLSTLMMSLQGQKLQLGQQNFYLKQILKNNNLNF